VLTFTASRTSDGRRASCVGRCSATAETTVMLLEDGTYRWPQGESRCANGDTTLLPDEVGRLAGLSQKGSTIRLRPRNLPELRAAIESCSLDGLESIATTLRVRKDTLVVRRITRLRRPGDPPMSVRTNTRFNALRLEARVAPLPPEARADIPSCEGEITLRCR